MRHPSEDARGPEVLEDEKGVLRQDGVGPKPDDVILVAALGDLVVPQRAAAHLRGAAGRVGKNHVPFDETEAFPLLIRQVHFLDIVELEAAERDVRGPEVTAYGSRRVIVFLHHGRLSCGGHGDNLAMDPLWQMCFDALGAPRVAAWVAGHNHNMGTYAARGKGTGTGVDLPLSAHGSTDGVTIFLNGAGGAQLYHQGIGTFPDAFANDATFGFLQIEIVDSDTAAFQHYSTGGLGAAAAAPIGPRTEIHLTIP